MPLSSPRADRCWSVVETAWGYAGVVGDCAWAEYVGYPEPTFDEATMSLLHQFENIGPSDPEALTWLTETVIAYFRGETIDWDQIPVRLNGTEFQTRIWQVCRSIESGQTRRYAEVAGLAGFRGAARAAGSALAANPFGLLVPCHRVVAANGIGGYGPKAERKQLLLALEGNRYRSGPGRTAAESSGHCR